MVLQRFCGYQFDRRDEIRKVANIVIERRLQSLGGKFRGSADITPQTFDPLNHGLGCAVRQSQFCLMECGLRCSELIQLGDPCLGQLKPCCNGSMAVRFTKDDDNGQQGLVKVGSSSIGNPSLHRIRTNIRAQNRGAKERNTFPTLPKKSRLSSTLSPKSRVLVQCVKRLLLVKTLTANIDDAQPTYPTQRAAVVVYSRQIISSKYGLN